MCAKQLNDVPPLELTVECYAGHRGEQEPRRVHFSGRVITVEEILDRWIAPDHRYFKLRGDDGALYIVRHDEDHGLWELTLYDSRGERQPREPPEAAGG